MPTRTILLVDDSPTHRSLMRVFLAGHGLEFVEADDAASALRILRKPVVDLVIADVRMPGMNGLEFVRQVRASDSPEVASIPIVLLTAETSELVSREAIDAGANAFLHKPVSSAGVLQVVERLLGLEAPTD